MLGKQKLIILFWFFLSVFASSFAHADNVRELLRQPGDPVLGNPRAPITVVEFFDYHCGHCVSMGRVIDSIASRNPDVRIVFKEFPIRGPQSELASRAALAAKQQGKYNVMRTALLNNDKPLTINRVLELARDNGLDENKLKKDLNDSRVISQIKRNYRLGQYLQVSGTPAFFIAKTNSVTPNQVNFVLGEMSQRELQTAIDQAK